MTDGVLSGKTGFTFDAGYCYVCAVQRDGKTFIISLLGCGWPNNKTYKWKDTMTLLDYGNENFSYRTYWQEPKLPRLTVNNGIQSGRGLWEDAALDGVISVGDEEKNRNLSVLAGCIVW